MVIQRITARLWNDILPGHKLVLQSTSNLSEPSHAFPPLAPAVLMVLVLYFIPPPHVLEHWFHCSHSFHSQSTTITWDQNKKGHMNGLYFLTTKIFGYKEVDASLLTWTFQNFACYSLHRVTFRTFLICSVGTIPFLFLSPPSCSITGLVRIRCSAFSNVDPLAKLYWTTR